MTIHKIDFNDQRAVIVLLVVQHVFCRLSRLSLPTDTRAFDDRPALSVPASTSVRRGQVGRSLRRFL